MSAATFQRSLAFWNAETSYRGQQCQSLPTKLHRNKKARNLMTPVLELVRCISRLSIACSGPGNSTLNTDFSGNWAFTASKKKPNQKLRLVPDVVRWMSQLGAPAFAFSVWDPAI